ncbi:hypothetical protein [Acidovorax lacteus]|uniref:Uncharacterized protein n=1 Tax=Acidovorax lacteus TaxID=1924988 RepID=A0ABP8LJZ6_9BURK
MLHLRRALITTACYLLSAYGLLGSLVVVGTSGAHGLPGVLAGLTVLLAWVCHALMGLRWVLDAPAPRWMPVLGTAAGCAGLLLWPLAAPGGGAVAWADLPRAAAVGLVLTLPCVLLAVYLVRFHMRRAAPGATMPAAM